MKVEQIIKLAERFARHRSLSLSTVATYAANDGKTFERLRNGGSCTIRTADRIVSWFSDHWPEDLAWPSDIPRPKRAAKRRRAA